jgi:hypothetical protein
MFELESKVKGYDFFGHKGGVEEINKQSAKELATGVFLFELPGTGLSQQQLEVMIQPERLAFYRGLILLKQDISQNLYGDQLMNPNQAEELCSKIVQLGHKVYAINMLKKMPVYKGIGGMKQRIKDMCEDAKARQKEAVKGFFGRKLPSEEQHGWKRHPFRNTPAGKAFLYVFKNDLPAYVENTMNEVYAAKEGMHYAWNVSGQRFMRFKFVSSDPERKGTVYQTIMFTDGRYKGEVYCSCATNDKRDVCKHILEVKKNY